MSKVTTYLKKRIEDRDAELLLFVLFFAGMMVYYGIRLFKYAPWYDELYTYYYFISNGPVYSAIHWPVPNNHIGYSVLSGILYVLTHSGFISLRGISFLAAAGCLILLFAVGRRLMLPRGFSLAAAAIYSGMWLVNNLAVQGRGYTLAAFWMLTALYCMTAIAMDPEAPRRYSVFFALSLMFGFYTVTSSLYWVVPVCLSAGIVLLLLRRYRQLIRLVTDCLWAAAGTFLLYLIVWLAIGSNLLIKEDGLYSGMGHISVILHHPFRAAMRGIDYMLATPYIQSVERKGYIPRLWDHWLTLNDQLTGYGTVTVVICLAAAAAALAGTIFFAVSKSRRLKAASAEDPGYICPVLLSVTVLCMTLTVPLIVWMQCKLPYFRVFSFYGAVAALDAVYILCLLFGALKKYFTIGLGIMAAALAFVQLSGTDYNTVYGSREQDVYELMKANDLTAYGSVLLTDCDQQYMYRFVYDTQCPDTDLLSADAAVIEKDMLDPEAEYSWENFYDYSTLDMDSLNSMKLIYENDHYLLYER